MPRATTGLSYLTISLVVFGSLVFTVFVTVPQWSEYQDAQELLKKTQAKREERTQFLASIDARKEELATYARDALALAVAFPERLQPADTLATLQSIATGSGAVVLETADPKKVSEFANTPSEDQGLSTEGETPTLPAARSSKRALEQWDTLITVRGSYSQVRAFIRDLEQALLLSDVQSVDLQALTSKEGGVTTLVDTLEGKILIRTYVQFASNN
jgi:hypothetical protein